MNVSTILRTPEALMALAATWPDPPAVMLQEYIPREVAEDWIFHAYCNARLGVPGRVHRREVPLVAAPGRRHQLRPSGAQRGARPAVRGPVPPARLPRHRRPGLALRSPRPAIQAPGLQPARRCPVPPVRDDGRHRRRPRDAPRPHRSRDPGRRAGRSGAGSRSRSSTRRRGSRTACTKQGEASPVPHTPGPIEAGVVRVRRSVAARARRRRARPRPSPPGSASSVGRPSRRLRPWPAGAAPAPRHRCAGPRSPSRGRTAAAARRSRRR